MRQELIEAIKNQKVIRLHYSAGYREVEPHTYGLGTSGNELLRGYQTGGASQSGANQGWKLFKLDEVNSMDVTDDSFTERPGYKKNDSAMSVIHAEI